MNLNGYDERIASVIQDCGLLSGVALLQEVESGSEVAHLSSEEDDGGDEEVWLGSEEDDGDDEEVQLGSGEDDGDDEEVWKIDSEVQWCGNGKLHSSLVQVSLEQQAAYQPTKLKHNAICIKPVVYQQY